MKTHKFCPKCGRPVVKAKRSATMDRYPYECFACDENFFRFEVIGKKDIELARTLQELDYLEGLSDGIFMPPQLQEAVPPSSAYKTSTSK